MNKRKGIGNVVSLWLGLTLASTVWADNDIAWHGFLSQGMMQASDSNFVNDSGDVSFKLTEVGVNLSYQISPTLRLASQAVYLNGGNRYPEGVRLDYLFLDWNLYSAETWQVNLNLGRFKNYHWLYSSTRDIPHTRPSIILPQSLYYDAFRDFAKGNDGAALLAQGDGTFGSWEFNWSYGDTPIERDLTTTLLGDMAGGRLEQIFDHQMSFYFQPRDSFSQFGVAFVNSDFKYLSSEQDAFVDGRANTRRVIFNYKYSAEFWDLSAEAIHENVIYQNMLFPGYYQELHSQGVYFQGRWFANSDLTFLARLDLFDLNKNDRSGEWLEEQSGGLIPHYFGYSDTLTLGVTYRLADNWSVQAEVHRFKGTGRLSPAVLPDTQINDREYWNLWAVQLMYWF
ncbi:TonB-dependent receptor [Bowmanella yangjiangensis]|uniref:TonB-dependent receptor n=1 Tax=Bowmanella yangjiangensis TaxID=2811230 RepID=A0ABS3CRG1_9ALTE|nr:TonB-dependent receptor [Bowmanella yangjiangensis]MBN7819119.1 TonB-dependent receptor [Bowmanella yangjiangensis]